LGYNNFMAISVTKASGVSEPFSEAKVRSSLKRAGAKPEIIDKVLVSLTGKLYDGITTRAIYRQVFDSLAQFQEGIHHRYSLKDAIMKLGPSGYPFEKFVARLLDHLGFTTQTQVTVQGQCIEHEIDVSALKDDQHFLIECKYHNRPGTKSRSRDALYTQARFEDVVAGYKSNSNHVNKFHQAWLVTNTKLTSNAVKYGRCKGMKLLAWRYPEKGSLEQLIEANNLHPLTCFTFLDLRDRQSLLQNDLVLCRDITTATDQRLSDLGLSSDKVKRLKAAAASLHG